MMDSFCKKIVSLFLIFAILQLPVFAKEKVKLLSKSMQEFEYENIPDEIQLYVKEDMQIYDNITIPKNSIITLSVMQAQKERRWHKSAYILCKLKNYSKDDMVYDISENNIYLIGREYTSLNKKDAAILSSEIVVTQAASIVASCFIVFAPVDILYFFTKGAITKEKNENWFKSGVSCAYDNSIFWFWLKGKPLDIEKDDTIQLKTIKEKRAKKLENQILKRKNRQLKKEEKRNKKKEEKRNRDCKKDAVS